MITLLSKLFIKDRDSISSPAVRKAYGMLCSLTGIFLNILLFAGKYIAGSIAGSIAVTADAFNNLSDAGSSVITLLGFRLASKKPDPGHPFGHGRIEYLSGVAVSMIIIVVGVQLGLESIDKIRSPEPVDASLLPMLILVASICVKGYMFLYNRAVGRKINSPGMSATAMDSLTDCLATLVVLISMLVARFTGVNIDGWSGAVVALFIIYSGFSAARDTLSPLLGSAPDPELVQRIVEIAEYELQKELGCDAVIHMDPISTDDSKTGQMLDELREAVDGLQLGITVHDFRIVAGPTHTNVIFDAVLPNDSPLTEDEAKSALETLVNSLWQNTHPKIHIDRPFV